MYEYPIKTTNPENLLGAGNRVGTFPIGRLNAWHGGVHIESNDEHIRTIADGVIIAYRIPQDYTKEVLTIQDPNDKTKTISEEALYSNAFVLIQHFYKSKSEELTHYSLYKHLWPSVEMSKNVFVSEIFQKAFYTIDTEADKPCDYGTFIYSSANKNNKILVPYGAKLIRDNNLSEKEKARDFWTKKEGVDYVKVTYIQESGKIFNDFFLDASKAKKIVLHTSKSILNVAIEEEVCYQIDHNNDCLIKPSCRKGLNERTDTNTKSNTTILHVIPKGTELEIEPIPINGNWHRVIYPEGWENQSKYNYISDKDNFVPGFIAVDTRKIKYECKGEVSSGSDITNCAIPVKAGMVLGRAGLYGFEKHDSYRAAHIEVFAESEREVNSFLDDKTPDDPNPDRFFKITKGTALSNTFSCALRKDTPVKILILNDKYVQIEITDVVKIVKLDYLGPYSPETKEYALTGTNTKTNKQANLAEINNVFGGFLISTDKLKLVNEKKEIFEDVEIKGTKIKKSLPAREVKYVHKMAGKKYWVDSGMINDGAKVAEIGSLSTDVSTVYFDDPDLFVPYKYIEDAILEVQQTEALTGSDNNIYYYLKTGIKDILNAQANTAGVIQKTSVKFISAYNWKEFGFNVIKDANNKNIYSCEKPEGFLKDLWDTIDQKDASGTKNKKLEYYELRAAFNNISIIRHLSKQICYHSSEWAVDNNFAPLKSEVEKLYDEGIALEEVGSEKNRLKKLKDEALKSLEERVKLLCWWDKVVVDDNNKPKPPKHKVPVQPFHFQFEVDKTKKPDNCLGKYKCGSFHQLMHECPLEFKIIPKTNTSKPLDSFFQSQLTEMPAWCKYGSSVSLIPPTPRKAQTYQEEEITLKPFPASPNVFHFHPIAFVEQMKRMEKGRLCEIDKDYFFSQYEKEFLDDNRKLPIRTKNNILYIFEGIENYENSKGQAYSKTQIAYILATIKHETGTYGPVYEANKLPDPARFKYYEEMYDPILGKNELRRKMAMNAENTLQGDGVKYAGKGYVQITWKKNYRKAKEKFNIDFVGNPDLALNQVNAIKITLYGFDVGMFTGKSIFDYIHNNESDYYNARRIINGLDKADTIKNYAEKIENCLKIIYI